MIMPDEMMGGAGGAGDAGAGAGDAGAGGASGAGDSNAALFEGLHIPSELHTDPEIIKLAKEMRAAKDPAAAAAATAAKDPAAAAAAAAAVAAKDPAAGEDEFDIEFTEDVTIGGAVFSKEAMKLLDKPALEAFGKMKIAYDELSEKSSQYEKDKGALLEDPVIADRIRRKAEGVDMKPYATGVTKEAKSAIVSKLVSSGMEQSVAEEIFNSVIAKEILADLEHNTALAVNNALLRTKTERDIEKVNEEGLAFVKELSKMDKALTEDKVRSWCLDPARRGSTKSGGLSYGDLVKMKNSLGPEAVYAAIAKANNLPVVLNSKERDKEMIKNDRERYFAAIGGKRVARAMASKEAPGTSGHKGGSIDGEGGVIDKTKLRDQTYTEGLLSRAKNPKDIFEIQRTLIQQSKEN